MFQSNFLASQICLFNTIRKDKIIAKNSEFTVLVMLANFFLFNSLTPFFECMTKQMKIYIDTLK